MMLHIIKMSTRLVTSFLLIKLRCSMLHSLHKIKCTESKMRTLSKLMLWIVFYFQINFIQCSVQKKYLNEINIWCDHIDLWNTVSSPTHIFSGSWHINSSCILEKLPQFFSGFKCLSCFSLHVIPRLTLWFWVQGSVGAIPSVAGLLAYFVNKDNSLWFWLLGGIS